MAFLAQFVDSIAASPTVRLSLQALPTWRVHIDGTEFPPPPLRRAVAQTLLADGASIPSSAYDLRTIRLVLSVNAVSADTVATQMQNLARELDRPTNIFMWQQQTTNPIFFRTFRTSTDSITDLGMFDGTRKLIQVELLAEPFGYGLKQTLSPVTVAMDPTPGTNPTYFDIAAANIIGDVETPLQLRVAMPASDVLARKLCIAVRSRGTPSSAPYLLQCEAMTQGTDTTTQANSVLYSGSSNNFSRTTFATDATLVTRLTQAPFPASAGVDLRGTYRVFIKAGVTVGGDVIGLRAQYNRVNLTTAAVTVPTDGQLNMVDLGLLTLPQGNDPVSDGIAAGAQLSVDPATLVIQASRTSGAGGVNMDYILFVPADYRFAIVYFDAHASETMVIDGATDQIYRLNGSGQVTADLNLGETLPFWTGALPTVIPNQDTRVIFNERFGIEANNTTPTTYSVTPAYWPRYLYVRPAAS